MVGPPAENSSSRLLEKLAKENMELRASLSSALERLASSSSAANLQQQLRPAFWQIVVVLVQTFRPVLHTTWDLLPNQQCRLAIIPSINDNVARYKRQNVSVEERIRLDIRNEKKRR